MNHFYFPLPLHKKIKFQDAQARWLCRWIIIALLLPVVVVEALFLFSRLMSSLFTRWKSRPVSPAWRSTHRQKERWDSLLLWQSRAGGLLVGLIAWIHVYAQHYTVVSFQFNMTLFLLNWRLPCALNQPLVLDLRENNGYLVKNTFLKRTVCIIKRTCVQYLVKICVVCISYKELCVTCKDLCISYNCVYLE